MAKSRLDDLCKWQITQLAKFGGFSLRKIASTVFSKPLLRVTTQDMSCVAAFLSRNKIRLRDWRDGILPQAQALATKVSTKKKRRHRTVRLAA
jgi:prephenate dehydrogenase